MESAAGGVYTYRLGGDAPYADFVRERLDRGIAFAYMTAHDSEGALEGPSPWGWCQVQLGCTLCAAFCGACTDRSMCVRFHLGRLGWDIVLLGMEKGTMNIETLNHKMMSLHFQSAGRGQE